MSTETGKPQIAQNVPVLAAGGAGMWNIEIGDGDFRTYVLVCQAAWQEQPQAEAPFTERNFADLARLHPARQRPTAETVRGRIYRLTKAGLVRRERSGRTSWRTYPLVEGRPMPKKQRGEQLAASNLAASELVTSQPIGGKVSARREHTQDEPLAASSLATSDSHQVVTARWERAQKQVAASELVINQPTHGELGARQEHTHDEPLAASSLATSRSDQDVSARWEHTQEEPLAASGLVTSKPTGGTVIACQEHTQEQPPAARHPAACEPEKDDLGARPEHTQDKPLATSSLAASACPEDLTARGEHTQEEGLAASSLVSSDSHQIVSVRGERTQDELLATSSLAPSRSTPPVFRSLALSHRNGMNPRQIVRRSVETPESPDAERPKQEALVYSLSDLLHIRPQDLAPTQPETPVGAWQEHTQEPLAARQLAASEPEEDDVSARSEHTQEERLATSGSEQAVTARQTRAQEQIEPTNAVGARPEHSQDEPLATSTSAQVVTARSEHTQDEPLATINLAASDSNQAVTAREARAQNEPLAPGTSPSRTRTRERASVLSGSDLPSSKTTPKPGGSSETDSTGDTNARAKGPRPPVLERVQVPEGFEDLAVQLASLRPQGMNYEGIAECLKNPELTRAWTEHALSTKEAIRNVPAYIRAGVRSGKLPVTDAEKEALQAQRRTNPAALAATDYGWDDPALKDWDVSSIFRKPGPSKGKDKYGWGDPDTTNPDPYGGPYVH